MFHCFDSRGKPLKNYRKEQSLLHPSAPDEVCQQRRRSPTAARRGRPGAAGGGLRQAARARFGWRLWSVGDGRIPGILFARDIGRRSTYHHRRSGLVGWSPSVGAHLAVAAGGERVWPTSQRRNGLPRARCRRGGTAQARCCPGPHAIDPGGGFSCRAGHRPGRSACRMLNTRLSATSRPARPK